MAPAQIRPPLVSRVPARLWLALDVAVAGFFSIGYLSMVAYMSDGAPRWYMIVSALATTLPVAVRRLWPRTAFTLVLLGVLGLYTVVGAGPEVLCLPLALYTVSSRRGRSSGLPAFAIAMAVSMWGFLAWPVTEEVRNTLALLAAVLGAAWAAGAMARAREEYAIRLAEHAQERARAEAAEQRLRIARELHDVVGHSLSTIAVQAGVNGHVGDREEMRGTLASIEATSRAALRETRRLLGVLRQDEEADLVPVPGLADLGTLVDRSSRTGLEVELVIEGEVPESLGLTVYRIVQEALTNVLKHAGARSARVLVRRAGERVTVEVSDDGRGGGPVVFGHGLTGLRERVHLYRGEFFAGPGPRRGFRVTAVLPL
ncbi:sensor histidine kinase [Nonomuraea sp. NPDC050663]|uniref:sensor histidine kinase n=1 Tax=Nonomuraea sp. NPDC050663 TaxID=3364370 RepID=UPI00379E5E8A